MSQTSLFEQASSEDPQNNHSEWGTFKDSLKAPIHGWFTYPAGFSYKAVEHSIVQNKLVQGKDTIYDPFMGSGTTNLVARTFGVNSIGVEAHPFVFQITKSKLEWNIKFSDIETALTIIEDQIKKSKKPNEIKDYLRSIFPELLINCFLPDTLFELLIIRNSIGVLGATEKVTNFLKTALICSLREVSIAATGWPYIAPKKVKITSVSKKGWETFKNRVYKMYSDICEIKQKSYAGITSHEIYLSDSRDTTKLISNECASHIFTSPPYLNNFDYADRTRLEMYFMGAANNWADISGIVRTKLITSATTQINRSDDRYKFLDEFKKDCPEQFSFLASAVNELSALRLTKGGKKSYDMLTIGYFNDMYKVLKDNFRILKHGSKAVYILGDSAPYGVHIPTDELIGQIGVKIGFNNYKINTLRARGGKWEKNPQRHNVLLRESIVTLEKK